MRTSILIERLRAACPSFTAIDHGLTSGMHTTFPVLLAEPAQETAESPSSWHPLIQRKRALYNIYVGIEPKLDGPTGGVADLLDDLREEVHAALYGWTPDSDHAPLIFVGGEMIETAQGIRIWRETWSTDVDIGR